MRKGGGFGNFFSKKPKLGEPIRIEEENNKYQLIKNDNDVQYIPPNYTEPNYTPPNYTAQITDNDSTNYKSNYKPSTSRNRFGFKVSASTLTGRDAERIREGKKDRGLEFIKILNKNKNEIDNKGEKINDINNKLSELFKIKELVENLLGEKNEFEKLINILKNENEDFKNDFKKIQEANSIDKIIIKDADASLINDVILKINNKIEENNKKIITFDTQINALNGYITSACGSYYKPNPNNLDGGRRRTKKRRNSNKKRRKTKRRH
jgi:hypothetical protein